MSYRHPKDPLPLHYAARRLGEVVGRGAMTHADASDTVQSWTNAQAGVDRLGLRMRLVHVVNDTAEETARARRNAETAIRWAIRPIIRTGTKAEVEEAAGRANGEVLTWEEIVPILREEWHSAHRRRR